MKTKACIWMLIVCLWAQTGLCATQERIFIHNDSTRTYNIYIPESYDGSEDVPLVMLLHGYSDSAVYMENQTGMNILSDQYGFIAVYAEGLPTGDGHNRQWTWGNIEAGSGDVNDAEFVPALIDKLTGEFAINTNEVYAIGWSRGAFLAHHLGARIPERFSAIAPCGGLLYADDLDPNSPPVSVIIFNADNDDAVPYVGYPDYGYPSAEDGASLWAWHNNCNMTSQVIRDDDRILAWQYPAPDGNGDVAFYMLRNQGHRYANDEEVWTSEIIWDFFAQHPKPGPTHAWNPSPADNEQDVDLYVGKPQWSAGELDTQQHSTHQIYFGTNLDGVNTATVPQATVTDACEWPIDALVYNTTYYWRIDEVSETDEVTRGHLWQFTTQNYRTVDNFESYTDAESNGITGVWTDGQGLETNGAEIGNMNPHYLAHQHYIQPSLAFDGEQSMPVYYDNNAGISEVTRPLDADWTQDDVNALSLRFKGFSGVSGGYTENPDGTYTVRGRGRDIFDVADQCHFVYKEISGKATIIARIDSIENTDPWAKAGIMIRDTLEPDATNAALIMTPERSGRFQMRTSAGNYTEILPLDEYVTAPYWVKLELSAGKLLKAYYGEDSENMTRLLTQVTMPAPVYVGLAVTSRNSDELCEAEFSNVTLTGTGSEQAWMNQDIGLIVNDALPMYVTVNDTVVAAFEDPNAVQSDEWLEWIIPLQSIADQGVDLTQVHSMSIEFGNGDNPQPNSKGLVFFDAIRLYQP
jgi:poly(3-hydroxybutyrate) depolymerase